MTFIFSPAYLLSLISERKKIGTLIFYETPFSYGFRYADSKTNSYGFEYANLQFASPTIYEEATFDP